jgi:putative aminopeptidase FrvX
MNIELLQQLCEASAVSGDEQEVRSILIGALEPAWTKSPSTASAALLPAKAPRAESRHRRPYG